MLFTFTYVYAHSFLMERTSFPHTNWSWAFQRTLQILEHSAVLYAISTKRHDAKLTTENIIRAKLLGYGGSMKFFMYYNLNTKKRGRATQERFDEAQISASQATFYPNSKALWGALQRSPGTNAPDTADMLTPQEKFCVFADTSPFLKVCTIVIHVKCNFEDVG
jgi:hypothetical protein